MKKKDLIKLWNSLNSLNGEYKVKFSYVIAKNKIKMRDEIKVLEECGKPSKKKMEFENKRIELATDMADKDKNGKPVIVDNQILIIEKENEFIKKFNELKNEYKEVIENHDKKMEEYENLLEQDVEFDGYQIDIENIPDTINPSVVEILMLFDLIKEENL